MPQTFSPSVYKTSYILLRLQLNIPCLHWSLCFELESQWEAPKSYQDLISSAKLPKYIQISLFKHHFTCANTISDLYSLLSITLLLPFHYSSAYTSQIMIPPYLVISEPCLSLSDFLTSSPLHWHQEWFLISTRNLPVHQSQATSYLVPTLPFPLCYSDPDKLLFG